MNTTNRTNRRPAVRLVLAIGGLVVATALTACASVAGVAAPGTTPTGPVTGRTGGSTTTAATDLTTGTSTGPTTDRTTGSTTGSPTQPTTPGCADHPHPVLATPNTPTGTPMITVTSGANSWIANSLTEPMGLSIYPDGTGIAADGVGEQSKAITTMRIGYVPTCTTSWAQQELTELAALDMGEAGVTDQGTTTVVYQPAGGAAIKISVYALGLGDEYVQGDGKANRARLSAVIAALYQPLDGAKPWVPNRLRVVGVPAPVESAGAPLAWPVKTTVTALLDSEWRGNRCGVVTGPTVGKVLAVLAQNRVYYRWTVGGRVTGLSIGPLVPGQDGCE